MRRLCVLLAATLLLAGCGGGDEASPTTTEGVTTGGTPVIDTFVVHETEYALKPSKVTLDRTGYYAIKAVNDGRVTHALAVTGHGTDETSNEIAPGKATTFPVPLRSKGTYRLFCPVDGHAGKGMEGTITVR